MLGPCGKLFSASVEHDFKKNLPPPKTPPNPKSLPVCIRTKQRLSKTLTKIFSIKFAGWGSETFLSAGDYRV